MSTQSLIAIQQPCSVRAVYCHHDGSPDGVGRILFEHYRDKNKVKQLINLGGLSSLGKNIGPENPELDDWGFQKEEVTIAYYRDLEIHEIHSFVYQNRDKLSEVSRQTNEAGYSTLRHLYYFHDGQWYYSDLGEPERWELLKSIIAR